MMLTNNRQPDWFFYPGWVVASAISFPIAFNIAWWIVSRITGIIGDTIVVDGQRHITEDFITVYVLMPMLGLVMGALHYFLLRRYVTRIAWWIGATILGCVLPMAPLVVVARGFSTALPIDPMWSGAIGFSIVGASLGLCQWLVLRGRFRHAAWWILFSIVGWGVAGMISGENVSTTVDVIALVFLPPIVACIAWWLLLGAGARRHVLGSFA